MARRERAWRRRSTGWIPCSTDWPTGSTMLHINTPLNTQLLDLAGLKLLELSDRSRFVGEQVQLAFGIPNNLDGAVVNPVIKPVDWHIQSLGHLWHRQVATDAARARLTVRRQL